MDQTIDGTIRQFVLDQLGETDASSVEMDTDLLQAGVLDSILMVSLAAFCEERFGLVLDLGELTEDNFRSVRALANFVRDRQE